MKNKSTVAISCALAMLGAQLVTTARGSSHMDAPLIIRDPAANTTDVYAFVHGTNNSKVLVTGLGVYPHEEPGVGPNKYNFDDDVLYQIHVALSNDLAAGRASLSYQFQFHTTFRDSNTILQSYTGVVTNIGDAAQNLVQTYTVTKVDHRGTTDVVTVLGTGIVPPNNEGFATPFYNQDNDGGSPAREGVATADALDRYTMQAVTNFGNGYIAFAGQRDDGFYGDIESIFDLLQLRNPGKDSQGGFNIHELSLVIPISELGGDHQIAGVYATTSRRAVRVLRDEMNKNDSDPLNSGRWVQIARQGNPLFNEGLVALTDKDLYSRTTPDVDSTVFAKYAQTPELAHLINQIVFNGSGPAPETNRTDIAGIFIPDLIKVDLSTGPCRLAGGGTNDVADPDDAGFSRLSIFGGDVLHSEIQDPFGNGGFIPGGWPNGRRFGDDVVDIAVSALVSDLRPGPSFRITVVGDADGVSSNDMAYSKVFPYEATPQNSRNHTHP